MTMSEAAPRAGRLSVPQVAGSVIVGIVFWFLAALLVRYFGDAGIFGGTAGIATFVLTIGLGWLTPRVLKPLARLGPGQLTPAIVWGTWAATCLDGTLLTWWPSFYHADPAVALGGAAWILWGAGWILIMAVWDPQS